MNTDITDITDINKITIDEKSLLYYTITTSSRFDSFLMLLKNGADPNVLNNGVSLLFSVWNITYLSELLKAGANPNVLDKDGMSLLNMYCKNASHEMVLKLLEHGADVNILNGDNFSLKTSLVWAVFYNRQDIARLLISKGANITIQKDILFKKSIEYNYVQLIELLLPQMENFVVDDAIILESIRQNNFSLFKTFYSGCKCKNITLFLKSSIQHNRNDFVKFCLDEFNKQKQKQIEEQERKEQERKEQEQKEKEKTPFEYYFEENYDFAFNIFGNDTQATETLQKAWEYTSVEVKSKYEQMAKLNTTIVDNVVESDNEFEKVKIEDEFTS
jgi:hypothetical protein